MEMALNSTRILGAMTWRCLCQALFLCTLLILSGCESCLPASNTHVDAESTISQASCPDSECAIGESFGCDKDHIPMECVDSYGCGKWQAIAGAQCQQDVEWCYHAQCFSKTDIPLPGPYDPELDLKLMSPYTARVSHGEDLVVIPYEAFMEALHMGQEFGAANNAQVEQSKLVALEANDINTLGMAFNTDEDVESFSGDLFLVVMDPRLAGKPWLNKASTVESTQYFLAAMPGLEGPTSWVGQHPMFVTQSTMALGQSSCCRGGQPGTSCKLDVNDVLPQPECLVSSTPACQFAHGTLAEHFQTTPSKGPFRIGGSTTRYDPEHTIQQTIRGNGMPAVTLFVSKGRAYHQALAQDYPTSLSHASTLLQTLQMESGVLCDRCRATDCRPEAVDYSDVIQIPSITNACGVPLNAGNDQPKMCHQFVTGGMLPAACGGVPWGLSEDHVRGPGIAGGTCALGMATRQAFYMDSGASSAVCTGGGVPDWCKWADGDACNCDAACQGKRDQLWVDVMGCGGFGSSSSSDTCCGANCACINAGSGLEVCTQCNDNGNCTEFVRGDVNSHYFDGDDDAQKETKQNNDEVEIETTDDDGDTSSEGTGADDDDEGSVQWADGTVEPLEADYIKVKPQERLQEGDSNPTPTKRDEPSTTVVQGQVPVVAAGSSEDKVEAVGSSQAETYDAPFQEALDVMRMTPDRHVSTTGTPGGQQVPNDKAGDPVLLGDGSLMMAHHDMTFPGAVMPLEFSRYYNSRSDDRSILGSNWTHTYDSFVLPINKANYVSWMPRYCAGQLPVTTCALMHYADGTERLFIKGPRSKGVFYPQAGSGDTLKFYGKFWELHTPDETVMTFNEHGYIMTYRDRFKNGYNVEYEPTPAYRMYQRHCRADTLEEPEDTPHLQCNGGTCIEFEAHQEIDLAFEATYIRYTLTQDVDDQLCGTLGAIVGDLPAMQLTDFGWKPTLDLLNSTQPQLSLSLARGALFELEEVMHGTTYFRDNVQVTLFEDERRDHEYVQWLLNAGAGVKDLTGQRKLRPIRVTDDLDRTLTFTYYKDLNDKETYGLLRHVWAPESTSLMKYAYERPADYLPRMHEAFLVSATRQDSTPTSGTVSQPSRQQTYQYNWPSHAFDSYDAHAVGYEAQFLDYFMTYTGCNWPANQPICRTESASTSGGMQGSLMTVCGSNGEFQVGTTFLASGTITVESCTYPTAKEAPGNPCFLAERRTDEYRSSVADNIVAVRFNHVVELESWYEVDPASKSFERVKAQRYGGLGAGAYPSTTPPMSQGAPAWQSNLPEYRFEHVSSGPVFSNWSDGGSNTAPDAVDLSGLLPAALTSRVAMEPEPLDTLGVSTLKLPRPAPCVMGAGTGTADETDCSDVSNSYVCVDDYERTGARAACTSNGYARRLYELPGVTPIYDYYDLEDDSPHGQIMRTRLTCRQIAEHHIVNPLHNDLLKFYEPPTGQSTLGNWKRVDRKRAKLEQDMRRVCAWVKTSDRDGDVVYAGMNFRGQEIVTAVEEGAQFIVTEKIVNADGLTIVDRHASLASSPWTPDDGYTEYGYDDVKEEVGGAPTWDIWRPNPWAKRFNLRRVTQHPEKHNAFLNLSHHWTSATNSLSGKALVKREVLIDYEPLFNQVAQMRVVGEDSLGGRETLHHVTLSFDYQEFAHTDPALAQAIREVKGWDLRMHPDDRAADKRTPGVNWIKGVIPMTFYGDQSASDLNDDTFIGFPNHSDPAKPLIRGFVVRQTVFDVTDPTFQTQRSDRIWPAPHGLPARHLTAGGEDTRFEYHSFRTNPYGTLPVQDADVSLYNRGLLGRVSTRHYSDNHGPDEGASDAGALLVPGQDWQSCDAFKGAYAWLMPQGCGQQDPASWMANQGIPVSIAGLVLDAQDQAENFSEVEIAYSALGSPAAVRRDGVLVASWVRDTDGRVMEVTDAEGIKKVYTRDARRNATKIQTFDASTTLVNQVHQQFDAENHVLTHCTDVNTNGCANAMSFTSLIAFDAPRDTVAPNYLLKTRRLTAEGLGWKTKDAMGLEQLEAHNARGLLISTALEAGSPRERRVTRHYDVRGRLERVEYGSLATRAALGEKDMHYTYDGFDQVRSMTRYNQLAQSSSHSDVTWHAAYSARGERVATKLDVARYYASSAVQHAAVEQEFLTEHDGYGRPVVMQSNNLERTSLTYDSRGHVRKRQQQAMDNGVLSSGEGHIEWMTYDVQGRLAWHVNQSGDMSFSVRDLAGRRDALVTMRRDAEHGVWLTTSSERDFDARDQLTDMLTTGHQGELQPSHLEYDALGRVIAHTTPDQQTTLTAYNMVGWPTKVREPGESGQLTPDTSYTYNARGQALTVVEPGTLGETTRYGFNLFGQRVRRDLPGTFEGYDTYTYDGYGRLSQHEKRTTQEQLYSTQNYTYTQHADGGESLWKTINVHGLGLSDTEQVITRDKLGRVIYTLDKNLEASYWAGSGSPLRVEQYHSYDLLGRVLTSDQILEQNAQTLSHDTLTYSYEIDPGSGLWEQTVVYPSGTTWEKGMNTRGQLSGLKRTHVDGGVESDPMSVDLRWLGELYAGRTQHYDGSVDPFEEAREFDGLGRVTQWSYSAVELDGAGGAQDLGWGATYCQGSWEAACALPLLSLSMRYDVMDRVTSQMRRFGHPALNSLGEVMDESEHLRQWRGYDYDNRGFLKTEWQVSDVDPSSFDQLANHVNAPSARQNLSQASGGAEWNYQRDATGDLETIAPGVQNTGPARWTHTHSQGGASRLERHELGTVTTAGLGSTHITHDGRGRVSYDGQHDYTYSAQERLIRAQDSTTQSSELYFYDASGRLVYIERANQAVGQPSEERFVYEGAQKVASYHDGALAWEGVWGAGLDHLLSWRHLTATTSRTYIPLRDHRQNVVALWDTTDKVLVGLSDYTAQGHRLTLGDDETVLCHEEDQGVLCPVLNDAFPFGFNSAWRSPLTGLSQMRHRWYSPVLGQFISHDPLEHIDSFNLYAFAERDAINGWDPFGLSGQSLANDGLQQARRPTGTPGVVNEPLPPILEKLGRPAPPIEPPVSAPQSTPPITAAPGAGAGSSSVRELTRNVMGRMLSGPGLAGIAVFGCLMTFCLEPEAGGVPDEHLRKRARKRADEAKEKQRGGDDDDEGDRIIVYTWADTMLTNEDLHRLPGIGTSGGVGGTFATTLDATDEETFARQLQPIVPKKDKSPGYITEISVEISEFVPDPTDFLLALKYPAFGWIGPQNRSGQVTGNYWKTENRGWEEMTEYSESNPGKYMFPVKITKMQ